MPVYYFCQCCSLQAFLFADEFLNVRSRNAFWHKSTTSELLRDFEKRKKNIKKETDEKECQHSI